MSGAYVPEGQERLQKLLLGLTDEGHIGAGLSATKHGGKSNDQNVVQGVPLRVTVTGTFQRLHIFHQHTHHNLHTPRRSSPNRGYYSLPLQPSSQMRFR